MVERRGVVIAPERVTIILNRSWVNFDRNRRRLAKDCVLTWCQSYKGPTIVIYDSRVVPDLKLPHITTLES